MTESTNQYINITKYKTAGAVVVKLFLVIDLTEPMIALILLLPDFPLSINRPETTSNDLIHKQILDFF